VKKKHIADTYGWKKVRSGLVPHTTPFCMLASRTMVIRKTLNWAFRQHLRGLFKRMKLGFSP